MLAIRARVVPWIARPSTDGSAAAFVTSTAAPLTATLACGCSLRCSSPLGPLTRTLPSAGLTVTPAGIEMIFLPMRDMAGPGSLGAVRDRAGSVERAEEFAAHVLLPTLPVREDPLRR